MSDRTDTGAAPEDQVPAANNFAQFIQSLEDGALHADLTAHLQEINHKLSQHVIDHGGKPKGSLTLKIDFRLDQGVFEIDAKAVVKVPDEPRGRSIMWALPDGRFTGTNPKQMSFFGPPRALGGNSDVRTG